jgi:hypothetical protein
VLLVLFTGCSEHPERCKKRTFINRPLRLQFALTSIDASV